MERLGSHGTASTSAGAQCATPRLRGSHNTQAPCALPSSPCRAVPCRRALAACWTAPARRSSVRPCGVQSNRAGCSQRDVAVSRLYAAPRRDAEPPASAAVSEAADAPALLAVGLALALAGALAVAAPAGAAESGVAYEPGAGGGLLKSLAGVAYLALVAVFVLRLLRKRANSSLTQVQLLLEQPLCF